MLFSLQYSFQDFLLLGSSSGFPSIVSSECAILELIKWICYFYSYVIVVWLSGTFSYINCAQLLRFGISTAFANTLSKSISLKYLALYPAALTGMIVRLWKWFGLDCASESSFEFGGLLYSCFLFSKKWLSIFSFRFIIFLKYIQYSLASLNTLYRRSNQLTRTLNAIRKMRAYPTLYYALLSSKKGVNSNRQTIEVNTQYSLNLINLLSNFTFSGFTFIRYIKVNRLVKFRTYICNPGSFKKNDNET